MSLFDSDLFIYILVIAAFLIFLVWGRRIGKKNQGDSRNRSFRQRYRERRKNDPDK